MNESTMRAVQINEYGTADVLKLVEVPVPQPGPGQVLVRVHAAGVNPVDWKFRAGYMKQFVPLSLPWTPGMEGAGVVVGLGPGVDQFQMGQSVYGLITGSYAEYAVAAASNLQVKPDALSFEKAATVAFGALTAWGAVFDTADVQPGQRVLVQGAAGGVGLYGVMLTRWKGAQVYGTASTVNLDYIHSLGAEAIDYHTEAFEQKLHDLDVVFDTVGGDIPQRSLQVLRPGGMLVTVATFLPDGFGNSEGVRATYGNQASADKLKDINRLVVEGILRPEVQQVLPLYEARQAHTLSETGHGRGRIVLQIAS